MLSPEYDDNGLPVTSSLIEIFNTVSKLVREGKVYACYTPTLPLKVNAALSVMRPILTPAPQSLSTSRMNEP